MSVLPENTGSLLLLTLIFQQFEFNQEILQMQKLIFLLRSPCTHW